MATDALHDRLRKARLSRGDRLDALSRRTGIRATWLQAIESARYEDLPRGIYARSAVKAYAEVLGLDVAAALAEAEPLLPTMEDPIDGLARMRGVRRPSPQPAAPQPSERQQRFAPRSSLFALRPSDPGHRSSVFGPRSSVLGLRSSVLGPRSSVPSWRPAAAAAIDAAIVLGMLTALIVVTVATFRIPLHAFGPGAALAFGTVGLLMAISYFAVFGGIAGETAGTQLVGLHANRPSPRVDLQRAGSRAFQSAVRDAQVIEDLAAWAVSLTGGGKSSANRHDTRPVGQAIGS
jgi:transcriptional regulator with XRE-family HTH domain